MPLPIESPEYQAFLRFAQLTSEKRALQDRLNEIEPRLRALEPVLLGYLGEGGYDKVQVEGFTMSSKREPWVYPLAGINRQAVCEALKLSGLERYVKENYNTRSLTAYVRELEEHHQLIAGAHANALRQILPAPLAEVLDVRPGFRLQVLDVRKKGRRTEGRELQHKQQQEQEYEQEQEQDYDE